MKNKKTIFTMMVGAVFALILNFFPQQISFAENDPAPACSWGYASVEKSWLNWNNDGYTKLCDCTPTSFIIDGTHRLCTPTPQ
ncbi:hypothetical protein [Peijinzhouia sedimentorum]